MSEAGHSHRFRPHPQRRMTIGVRTFRKLRGSLSIVSVLVPVAAFGALLGVAMFAIPPLVVGDESLNTTDRLAAQNDIRTSILQAAAGVAVLTGLIFTARSATLTRFGQIADRFSKAIGQLGDESIDVRNGAFYALERIAIEAPSYRAQVREVLVRYVAGKRRINVGDEPLGDNPDSIPDDIQVAISVLARRKGAWAEESRLDLYSLNLVGMNADNGKLDQLMAHYSRLDRAEFINAHLKYAGFGWAVARNSFFGQADLRGATFYSACIEGSFFQGANLRDVDFGGAHLDRVDFTGRKDSDGRVRVPPASLKGANFEGARTKQTNFRGVNLSETVGLTSEQISVALIDDKTLLPEGVKRGVDGESKSGD